MDMSEQTPVSILTEEQKELAARYDIDPAKVATFIQQFYTLNQEMKQTTTPEGFKRVRVGKLIVPKSFDELVENICRIAGISVSTFYQGMLFDAMNRYVDQLEQKAAEVEAQYAETPSTQEEQTGSGTVVAEEAGDV